MLSKCAYLAGGNCGREMEGCTALAHLSHSFTTVLQDLEREGEEGEWKRK